MAGIKRRLSYSPKKYQNTHTSHFQFGKRICDWEEGEFSVNSRGDSVNMTNATNLRDIQKISKSLFAKVKEIDPSFSKLACYDHLKSDDAVMMEYFKCIDDGGRLFDTSDPNTDHLLALEKRDIPMLSSDCHDVVLNMATLILENRHEGMKLESAIKANICLIGVWVNYYLKLFSHTPTTIIDRVKETRRKCSFEYTKAVLSQLEFTSEFLMLKSTVEIQKNLMYSKGVAASVSQDDAIQYHFLTHYCLAYVNFCEELKTKQNELESTGDKIKSVLPAWRRRKLKELPNPHISKYFPQEYWLKDDKPYKLSMESIIVEYKAAIQGNLLKSSNLSDDQVVTLPNNVTIGEIRRFLGEIDSGKSRDNVNQTATPVKQITFGMNSKGGANSEESVPASQMLFPSAPQSKSPPIGKEKEKKVDTHHSTVSHQQATSSHNPVSPSNESQFRTFETPEEIIQNQVLPAENESTTREGEVQPAITDTGVWRVGSRSNKTLKSNYKVFQNPTNAKAQCSHESDDSAMDVYDVEEY